MAQNGVFRLVLAVGLLACIGLGAGSCMTVQNLNMTVKNLKLKDLIEPDVPDSMPAGGGTSYRALSDIPDAPAISDNKMRDSAVEGLNADRAAAVEAANRLRDEPFTQPDPAPPPETIVP